MYIHLHTIHTEYIDIQMKPNASLKKLIAFLPFLPLYPCKPYFINIYTHPSLLLIQLMSVKMFVVWQIYIIEHYRKMLPNRFYFCYDNDVIFMNTSHISRYIVYRFIFVLELCSLNVWNNKRSSCGSTICFTLSLILQLH